MLIMLSWSFCVCVCVCVLGVEKREWKGEEKEQLRTFQRRTQTVRFFFYTKLWNSMQKTCEICKICLILLFKSNLNTSAWLHSVSLPAEYKKNGTKDTSWRVASVVLSLSCPQREDVHVSVLRLHDCPVLEHGPKLLFPALVHHALVRTPPPLSTCALKQNLYCFSASFSGWFFKEKPSVQW